MLFQEFGEDRIAALYLGFELLDLLVLGVFDGLGLAAVVEGGLTVLEEVLEPAVKLVGINVEFIAQVGDRDLVDEMTFEDGDLFGAGKVTWLFCFASVESGRMLRLG